MQALESGDIDMITTDHSPCPPAMKCREEGRFDKAWGGIASLGLALPAVWKVMHGRGVKLESMAKWMASAPARLAGFEGRKGALVAGADADLVVFDDAVEWTISEPDLRFRHKLSPYVGAAAPRTRARNMAARRNGLFSRSILWLAARQRAGARMKDRAQNAIAECLRLAAFTEQPGRITRRFLTPPMHGVHDQLRETDDCSLVWV